MKAGVKEEGEKKKNETIKKTKQKRKGK